MNTCHTGSFGDNDRGERRRHFFKKMNNELNRKGFGFRVGFQQQGEETIQFQIVLHRGCPVLLHEHEGRGQQLLPQFGVCGL